MAFLWSVCTCTQLVLFFCIGDRTLEDPSLHGPVDIFLHNSMEAYSWKLLGLALSPAHSDYIDPDTQTLHRCVSPSGTHCSIMLCK